MLPDYEKMNAHERRGALDQTLKALPTLAEQLGYKNIEVLPAKGNPTIRRVVGQRLYVCVDERQPNIDATQGGVITYDQWLDAARAPGGVMAVALDEAVRRGSPIVTAEHIVSAAKRITRAGHIPTTHTDDHSGDLGCKAVAGWNTLQELPHLMLSPRKVNEIMPNVGGAVLQVRGNHEGKSMNILGLENHAAFDPQNPQYVTNMGDYVMKIGVNPEVLARHSLLVGRALGLETLRVYR
jgi:hypothetical protein